jgi:malate/lactate dehydrogenase
MKVSIIGAGNVGATVAYTLLVKGGGRGPEPRSLSLQERGDPCPRL